MVSDPPRDVRSSATPVVGEHGASRGTKLITPPLAAYRKTFSADTVIDLPPNNPDESGRLVTA